MQHSIPIICDTLSSEELLNLFQPALPKEKQAFEFTLLDNEQNFRSPFADPTVLAAIISASATTLAAIIALVGVVWAKRKKENGTEATIEVKLNRPALELIQGLSPEKVALLQQLLTVPEGRLRLPGAQPSEEEMKVLEQVPARAVEHIAILEDE